MRGAITKRAVDGAQPGPKDYFIWDTAVPGFGVKVTPAGSRIYVFQYRLALPGAADKTPPRRYTIGKHGKITPDIARKRAKALAAMVEEGIDPRQKEIDERIAQDEERRAAEEKARLENELTFEKISYAWLDHYETEKERRPASVKQAQFVVDRFLVPALGSKPTPHITREDIERVIDSVPVAQKATRRAVYVYASVLFGWAVRKRYCDENPLRDIEKPAAPRPRDRVLDDDELLAVWRATHEISLVFGAFFRLLILTGQRRSEVAGLSWDELDRSTATWTIAAERAKNDKSHIVPLSEPVLAELDQLSAIEQSDDEDADPANWPKKGLILTTNGSTPISGIGRAKMALDKSITENRVEGPLEHWRIHDLRRTLATGLQRLGVRFEVTEAVLNHISGAKSGVAGVYQRHEWKDEKRAALDGWAHHVMTLIEEREDDTVVSIDKARKPRISSA